MKRGDLYQHFKGDDYRFEHIALPLCEVIIADGIGEWGIALDAHTPEGEELRELKLYCTENGIILIDSEYPHVIYQTEEDYRADSGKTWARRVDDYFSMVQVAPFEFKHRFTLKQKGEM